MRLKIANRLFAATLAATMAVPNAAFAAEVADTGSAAPDAAGIVQASGTAVTTARDSVTQDEVPTTNTEDTQEGGVSDGSGGIVGDTAVDAPSGGTEGGITEVPVPEVPDAPAPEAPAPEAPATETPAPAPEEVPGADAQQPEEAPVPEEGQPAAPEGDAQQPEEAPVPEEGQPAAPEGDGQQGEAPPEERERQEVIHKTVKVEPVDYDDFRFYTVLKKYAFASGDISIMEGREDGAREIGMLAGGGVCYIIKDCRDGWFFVESGDVRGFVQADKIAYGEDADAILKGIQEAAAAEAEAANSVLRKEIAALCMRELPDGTSEEEFMKMAAGINMAEGGTALDKYKAGRAMPKEVEQSVPVAQETVSWRENKALGFSRGTTRSFIAEKDYAVTKADLLNVREGAGTDTRVVATLGNGTLSYVLADAGNGWSFIESGDVRGFVAAEYVRTGDEVDAEVAVAGEESYPTAIGTVGYKDVSSLYYVRESVKEGLHNAKSRDDIVQYAQQFVGNPYVWGGNDPETGADCSGFVKAVYGAFGYDLPRIAEDQAYCGEKIAVEDALPGDLLFYADENGGIYHVAMYAGNNMTVEAKSEEYGICNSGIGSPVWAARIATDGEDFGADVIIRYAGSESYGEYLGNFKLTYYCACSICCGEYAAYGGRTASGTQATEGRTIAVDPTVIPYGTEVIIGDRVYVAEDCGGAIKGNKIDIFMYSHEECLKQTLVNADVYIKR